MNLNRQQVIPLRRQRSVRLPSTISPPDPDPRGAQNRLGQLQEEVLALRKALLRAEHTLAQKEALLRNAQRREMELRAQLARRCI